MNHEQRESISVAPDENCVVIGPDLRRLKVIGSGRGGLIKRLSGSAVRYHQGKAGGNARHCLIDARDLAGNGSTPLSIQ
jgi:hypothetical protein